MMATTPQHHPVTHSVLRLAEWCSWLAIAFCFGAIVVRYWGDVGGAFANPERGWFARALILVASIALTGLFLSAMIAWLLSFQRPLTMFRIHGALVVPVIAGTLAFGIAIALVVAGVVPQVWSSITGNEGSQFNDGFPWFADAVLLLIVSLLPLAARALYRRAAEAAARQIGATSGGNQEGARMLACFFWACYFLLVAICVSRVIGAITGWMPPPVLIMAVMFAAVCLTMVCRGWRLRRRRSNLNPRISREDKH